MVRRGYIKGIIDPPLNLFYEIALDCIVALRQKDNKIEAATIRGFTPKRAIAQSTVFTPKMGIGSSNGSSSPKEKTNAKEMLAGLEIRMRQLLKELADVKCKM